LKLYIRYSSSTIIFVHVYIISVIPITYRNSSVRGHSECACLHHTVNIVVFFTKTTTTMKLPTQKESTHANAQRCPSYKMREYANVCIVLLIIGRYDKAVTVANIQWN